MEPKMVMELCSVGWRWSVVMGKTTDPAEIDEFTRAFEGLAAKAMALGMHVSREEIARRMRVCQEAGVADPDEFERCVLSEDAA
jgi:hypothetical protein